MNTKPEPDLESRRAGNLRQRLLRASRAVNAAIVQDLQERGFTELRAAHTALLSNLELGGASLTTVADRAGMSKQVMGRLAEELIRLGYITRTPDNRDRRAVTLAFTEAGLDLMHQSFAVMAGIETRCRRRLGKHDYAVMLDALSIINEVLDERLS